jgi:hypothetical protein
MKSLDPLEVRKNPLSGESIPTEARCYRCEEFRPVSEFAGDKSKASGRKSICKRCDREKSKRYYYSNLEKARRRSRDANRRRRDRLSEERGPYRLRRSWRAP